MGSPLSRRRSPRASKPKAASFLPSCCASRASFSVAGRARSRGGGRGSFPASARLVTPARRLVLGIACRYKPRPTVARPGPEKRGAAAARANSRSLHRGLRDRRSQSGEGGDRRGRMSEPYAADVSTRLQRSVDPRGKTSDNLRRQQRRGSVFHPPETTRMPSANGRNGT